MAKQPVKCDHEWRVGRSDDSKFEVRRCAKCDARGWRKRGTATSEWREWVEGEN